MPGSSLSLALHWVGGCSPCVCMRFVAGPSPCLSLPLAGLFVHLQLVRSLGRLPFAMCLLGSLIVCCLAGWPAALLAQPACFGQLTACQQSGLECYRRVRVTMCSPPTLLPFLLSCCLQESARNGFLAMSSMTLLSARWQLWCAAMKSALFRSVVVAAAVVLLLSLLHRYCCCCCVVYCIVFARFITAMQLLPHLDWKVSTYMRVHASHCLSTMYGSTSITQLFHWNAGSSVQAQGSTGGKGRGERQRGNQDSATHYQAAEVSNP